MKKIRMCEEQVSRSIHILTSLVGVGILSSCLAVASQSSQSEDHLRERIVAYYQAVERGDLESTAMFGSQKSKATRPLSPKERERAEKEMKLFLQQEKLVYKISRIGIEGVRAVVKMEVSMQLPDGSIERGEVYDLWVLENGDWYMRDGGRTRPESLPKD